VPVKTTKISSDDFEDDDDEEDEEIEKASPIKEERVEA
jgi:hypothetical protein